MALNCNLFWWNHRCTARFSSTATALTWFDKCNAAQLTFADIQSLPEIYQFKRAYGLHFRLHIRQEDVFFWEGTFTSWGGHPW
jgi:hypothetical protein